MAECRKEQNCKTLRARENSPTILSLGIGNRFGRPCEHVAIYCQVPVRPERQDVGAPFEGVIKIREMHVKFRGDRPWPLTFWHGFAQITHKQADRQFLVDNTCRIRKRRSWCSVRTAGADAGVCLARVIEGSDFNMAIAGVESFA